jgi:nucleoside-diphosphate-sugar epimerase
LNLVIGSRGRLGSGISQLWGAENIIAPERAIYSNWWQTGSQGEVSHYLETCKLGAGIVYVTAGIIDPSLSLEKHQMVNFHLARNIVLGAIDVGLRVVTFGTVMELLVDDDTRNPYFASKRKLGHLMEELAGQSNRVLHVRIHTIYGGGQPEPFMFLGQILNALRRRAEFRMTAGLQLREYHHIDDEVAAVVALSQTAVKGAFTLSHGSPVSLKDLASYVFQAMDAKDLLHIGVLEAPIDDNYGLRFQRPALLEGYQFRETLPAVVAYLNAFLDIQSSQ